MLHRPLGSCEIACCNARGSPAAVGGTGEAQAGGLHLSDLDRIRASGKGWWRPCARQKPSPSSVGNLVRRGAEGHLLSHIYLLITVRAILSAISALRKWHQSHRACSVGRRFREDQVGRGNMLSQPDPICRSIEEQPVSVLSCAQVAGPLYPMRQLSALPPTSIPPGFAQRLI